jgi:hypothetical protein
MSRERVSRRVERRRPPTSLARRGSDRMEFARSWLTAIPAGAALYDICQGSFQDRTSSTMEIIEHRNIQH